MTGPLEVVGVARLPQPAGLASLFAHPPARGCRTEALAPPVPGVGNKARIAMQALGARRRSSHRPEEDASLTPNPTRPLPKKPQGRKNRRRKNRLRPIRKKTHPKNTPPIPLFKPPTSSGFQLGADTWSDNSALSSAVSTLPRNQSRMARHPGADGISMHAYVSMHAWIKTPWRASCSGVGDPIASLDGRRPRVCGPASGIF